MKIFCPKCKWRPGPEARWACNCGHLWNTFATHGRCPACDKLWQHTQCLACEEWSLHEHWYHDDDLSLFERFVDEEMGVVERPRE